MSCEEVGEMHADRLYERSDALATELEVLFAGRPMDVVICSMGLALVNLLKTNEPVPDEHDKLIQTLAMENVVEACTGCAAVRRHKVMYAYMLSYSLNYLATLLDLKSKHVAPKER